MSKNYRIVFTLLFAVIIFASLLGCKGTVGEIVLDEEKETPLWMVGKWFDAELQEASFIFTKNGYRSNIDRTEKKWGEDCDGVSLRICMADSDVFIVRKAMKDDNGNTRYSYHKFVPSGFVESKAETITTKCIVYDGIFYSNNSKDKKTSTVAFDDKLPTEWEQKNELYRTIKALIFESDSSFSIEVKKLNGSNPDFDSDELVPWDGELYYCNDSSYNWSLWQGNAIQSKRDGGKHILRLCGLNNTRITATRTISRVLAINGDEVLCSGDIRSLLDFADADNASMSELCFYGMFSGCTSLTTAPALPATTLADGCYSRMFSGCTSLKSAPVLPATELADSCYANMFTNCTSLKSAPLLPATTLSENCYELMFSGCTSLESAPELPATILAEDCYSSMFEGCTSLESAPELPVTTLEKGCYGGMFYGCTSLESAPELPATTLADHCYSFMFTNCTSLTTAPALPATTLIDSCYLCMFQNCTYLESLPALVATQFASECLMNMFAGCSSLKFSEERVGEYYNEFKIGNPSTSPTLDHEIILHDIISDTSGTFNGIPYIGQTLWTSNNVIYP